MQNHHATFIFHFTTIIAWINNKSIKHRCKCCFMPTCHIAIMSPYASLKLWPVSPSEANIDQFHPECSLVTQTMVPRPSAARAGAAQYNLRLRLKAACAALASGGDCLHLLRHWRMLQRGGGYWPNHHPRHRLYTLPASDTCKPQSRQHPHTA